MKESGVYDVEVSKNGYKSLVETLMLNESIELQIMLTSNAGTADPTFTSATKTETSTYVDRNAKEKEVIVSDTKTIKDDSIFKKVQVLMASLLVR